MKDMVVQILRSLSSSNTWTIIHRSTYDFTSRISPRKPENGYNLEGKALVSFTISTIFHPDTDDNLSSLFHFHGQLSQWTDIFFPDRSVSGQTSCFRT